MAKPTIEEVAADLTDVLKIANNFSYLWNEGEPLHGKEVVFTSRFLAADDEWNMAVQKKDRKFYFHAKDYGRDLSPQEASKALLDVGYIGTRGRLVEDFKASLMKPLGKYLAKREIEKV